MQSLIQLYYFLQFLCKLPRKDTHVTALTFSPDGDRIALAYSVAGQRVRMKCAYIDDKHVILGLIPFVCFSLNCGAQDSSVGKKPGFAIYRLQVRASLLVGFFWYGPLASPPPTSNCIGSDHRSKKMEVPTSKRGSRSLHFCQ